MHEDSHKGVPLPHVIEALGSPGNLRHAKAEGPRLQILTKLHIS